MPVIESKVDTNSAQFKQNREDLLAKIAEFRAIEAKGRAEEESKRDKFHKRGQLLPRERVHLMIDRGSPWLELQTLAGATPSRIGFPVPAPVPLPLPRSFSRRRSPGTLKRLHSPLRNPLPMPGRSPSHRGFTLLELLIVLLVISLCAATTVRWYFSHADVTLENAAILLARDVRAAQHRSIFLGEKSRFVFLSDGSGYSVLGAAGEPARNPQSDEPFLRVYSNDGVFNGVCVLEVQAGSDRTLEIDGRGVPLEDLSVTLAYRDERRTILLDRKSSEITLVGSTSGWVDDDR
jgi:prepilin-type N-terminal cleavage/methylation domain-containing protein